jgi:hypothetical protein
MVDPFFIEMGYFEFLQMLNLANNVPTIDWRAEKHHLATRCVRSFEELTINCEFVRILARRDDNSLSC